MSIRIRVAISLTRLATLFSKSCKQSLQRRIAEANKQFSSIHQEKRDAISRAEKAREEAIIAANKKRSNEQEQAEKVAAAQELRLADKSSNYYAALHELEQGTGIA